MKNILYWLLTIVLIAGLSFSGVRKDVDETEDITSVENISDENETDEKLSAVTDEDPAVENPAEEKQGLALPVPSSEKHIGFNLTEVKMVGQTNWTNMYSSVTNFSGIYDIYSLNYSILDAAGNEIGQCEILADITGDYVEKPVAVAKSVSISVSGKQLFSVELTFVLNGENIVDGKISDEIPYELATVTGGKEDLWYVEDFKPSFTDDFVSQITDSKLSVLNLCTLDIAGLFDGKNEINSVVNCAKFYITADGVPEKMVSAADDTPVEIYKYDGLGNLIQINGFTDDGQPSRITYNTYDLANRLIKTSVHEADNSFVYATEYEYDSEGNLIKKIGTSIYGSMNYITEYDANGEEIRTTMPMGDDCHDMPYYYELNSSGLIILEASLNDDGTEAYRFEFTYDSDGNRYMKYYENGELVREGFDD